MQYLAGTKRLIPPRFEEYICNGAYAIITFRGQFIQPPIQPIDGSGWPGILSSRNCIPFSTKFHRFAQPNAGRGTDDSICNPCVCNAVWLLHRVLLSPDQGRPSHFPGLHPVLLRLGALSHPCLFSPRLCYIYRI